MKNISYIFAIIVGLITTNSSSIYAQQCNNGGCTSIGTPYPTSGSPYTPPNSWQVLQNPETKKDAAFNAGNYTIFNVISGNTYEWTYCESYGGTSTSWDAQLTLFRESNLSTLCYSTDVCGDKGDAPYIRWTATFNGTVRLLTTAYISGVGCRTNSGAPFNKLAYKQSSGSGSGKPDLTITSGTQSTSPTTVCAGSTISASCSIDNSGNAASGASSVTLWLSKDAVLKENEDIYIGTISGFPSLAPNSNSNVRTNSSLAIPASTPAGVYNLFFWADGYNGNGVGNIIAESDDYNNFATRQITVQNCCTDNYEPNDSYTQAYSLFSNPLFETATCSGVLKSYISKSGDQDWYRIGVDGPGTLKIDLTNLPANYDMELYPINGLSGESLAESLNSGTTSESISYTHSPFSSTYFYVKVYPNPYSVFSCNSYSLNTCWTPKEICTYSISPSSASPLSSSGNGTVSVTATAGCSWTAVSNNTSWLSITSGSNGTGNGTVNYSYISNPNSTSRTGTITIAGRTYTVTQGGINCTYSISPSSASPLSSSGDGTVSVTATAGCSWTAVSNNTSWLSITSGSNGTGNGTVNYSYISNPNSTSRTGTITIAGRTYTVTQGGINCTYSISPSSASPLSSSGNGTVSVTATAGCSWTAVSNNTSWLSITSGSNGTGNGTVNYSYISNPNSTSRTGTITIAGRTYTVTQGGINCTYSISPSSASPLSSSGNGTVSVTATAGCSWTAVSNNTSWLSITSGSNGTGNGTVNYSYISNPNSTSRTGTITIAGRTYTVTQVGTIFQPSEIVIQNNIPHFSSTKKFWEGNSNENSAVIKICADGSNATEIIFTNNTGIENKDIHFWIASDTSGANSAESGYFITNFPDRKIEGNKITVRYTHPKYVETQHKPFKPDVIKVVDIKNPNAPIFIIPIQIYRAPVVLVHGFTGGGEGESFEITKNMLLRTEKYKDELIKVADYESSSFRGFKFNKGVVPKEIKEIFENLRAQNYSCGKVDLVGFSMGGILSRIYLQSSDYIKKQDINKLITINTPHSGSQWGNFVLSLDPAKLLFGELIGFLNNILGMPLYKQFDAVIDLSVNSEEIINLNSYPSLNNSVVPTHVISTFFNSAESIPKDNFFYSLANNGIILLNNTETIPNLLQVMFGKDENDGVVSVPSQSGGLNTPYFSESGHHFHLKANYYPPVVTELENALDKNPNNQNYFTNNGFSPVSQTSNFKITPTDSITKKISETEIPGSISINYPETGKSFDKGAIIPVSVELKNGINRVLLVAINTFDKCTTIDTIGTIDEILYKVPLNVFGKVKLVTMGFKNKEYIAKDTVTININQTATLDSIVAVNGLLYIQHLNTQTLTVEAYFSDSTSYWISEKDGVEYIIADTSIARFYYGNLIYGKKIGETIVKVIYQDKTIEIPIYVTERDTTIDPEDVCEFIQYLTEITGEEKVCLGDTISNSVPNVPGSESFVWSYSGIGTLDEMGNNISLIPQTTGILSVTIKSLCDSIVVLTKSIQVINLEKPQITSSGSTSICQGDSLTLTSSIADSYLWSTGDTTQSIIISDAGNYTVTVTEGTCSETSDSVSIFVIEPSSSSVDAEICLGKSYSLPNGTIVSTSGTYPVTLKGSGGCDSIVTTNLTVVDVLASIIDAQICSGKSYSLPNGTIVSTSGTYPVALKGSAGCDSIVTTNLTVVDVLASTIDAQICSGKSYTLPNGTIVSTSGTYPVTLKGSGVCDSIITTNLTIIPLSEIPVIEREGNTLVSSYSTGNQWFYNGVLIDGEIEQFLILDNTGLYTVQYTNATSCKIMSEEVNIISVSINENQTGIALFQIYPNPNDGYFTIEIEAFKSRDAKLEIVNSLGQVIKSQQLQNLNEKRIIQADLSELSKGLYFVKLYFNNEIINRRVAVQ